MAQVWLMGQLEQRLVSGGRCIAGNGRTGDRISGMEEKLNWGVNMDGVVGIRDESRQS